MMGRAGCTFAALLKMALALEMMYLSDCAYVREWDDVSAGSSGISGILHVHTKNIEYINGKIRKMLFLDRS